MRLEERINACIRATVGEQQLLENYIFQETKVIFLPTLQTYCKCALKYYDFKKCILKVKTHGTGSASFMFLHIHHCITNGGSQGTRLLLQCRKWKPEGDGLGWEAEDRATGRCPPRCLFPFPLTVGWRSEEQGTKMTLFHPKLFCL